MNTSLNVLIKQLEIIISGKIWKCVRYFFFLHLTKHTCTTTRFSGSIAFRRWIRPDLGMNLVSLVDQIKSTGTSSFFSFKSISLALKIFYLSKKLTRLRKKNPHLYKVGLNCVQMACLSRRSNQLIFCFRLHERDKNQKEKEYASARILKQLMQLTLWNGKMVKLWNPKWVGRHCFEDFLLQILLKFNSESILFCSLFL